MLGVKIYDSQEFIIMMVCVGCPPTALPFLASRYGGRRWELTGTETEILASQIPI